MAFTIIKNNKTQAVVKVVAGASNTITLANLAYKGVTPIGADIKSVFYSSKPSDPIEVTRNTLSPDNVLDLWGSGYIDFDEKFGCPIAESSDQDIGVNPKNSANDHFTVIIDLVKKH